MLFDGKDTSGSAEPTSASVYTARAPQPRREGAWLEGSPTLPLRKRALALRHGRTIHQGSIPLARRQTHERHERELQRLWR
jgi:hypothetical protein